MLLARYLDSTNPWVGSYQHRPAVDIHEDDRGIHIHMDLARVKPEDVKVEVERGVLTISGHRELNQEGFHKVERFSGSYSRSFQMPDDVDSDAIEAHYEHGVVVVTLPKSEVYRRSVEVKTLSN